jgi:hypothetical protein
VRVYFYKSMRMFCFLLGTNAACRPNGALHSGTSCLKHSILSCSALPLPISCFETHISQMMFLTSLSRVFGICLLSLLLSLLPTPAVGRQLSSITNGVHRSQCNLNQPSKHPAIEGRSLTPRDCAPDEGEDHVIPQDYWSFYPYTTAIRSLGEHEHKFFGPLGYHTRNTEQRATDQTYLWFIPKRTTTVDATQTIHKAALTETVYITKTKTTTVTRMSRETITVARRTVTATVYDRPYLTRGAVIPWGHLFTARHSGMYLKHCGSFFYSLTSNRRGKQVTETTEGSPQTCRLYRGREGGEGDIDNPGGYSQSNDPSGGTTPTCHP